MTLLKSNRNPTRCFFFFFFSSLPCLTLPIKVFNSIRKTLPLVVFLIPPFPFQREEVAGTVNTLTDYWYAKSSPFPRKNTCKLVMQHELQLVVMVKLPCNRDDLLFNGFYCCQTQLFFTDWGDALQSPELLDFFFIQGSNTCSCMWRRRLTGREMVMSDKNICCDLNVKNYVRTKYSI